MAKVFYVVENAPDYSQVHFFKTEKEALEYGISQLPNFDMYGEPMNDEEADGEEWYTGDSLTFKKGILYTVEDGDVEVRAMDEDAAREYVTGLDDESYVAIFFDGFTKGMYGYQGSAADGKGYKWDWDGYDINESKHVPTFHLKENRYVPTFEQFLNEKVYRMTGIYTAKGLVGKVMQAFKQEIARVKYEGANIETQEEVNKEWAKFEDKAKKIILDQVEKGAGGMDDILFVTANLSNGFHIDEINGLNREGSNTLYLAYELVINVGFMDDANGSKFKRKIDKTGMMNSPIASGEDVIYGNYDTAVGNNNLEIRDTEYIQIDGN